MKRCARIAALVLVLAGMTSSLATQLPLVRDSRGESGGCHEHGSKAPTAPVPADHACCVAGHHSAILRPMCAAPPALRDTCEVRSIAPPIAEIALALIPAKAVAIYLPDGIAPLRI